MNDYKPYVWKTANFGQSWTAISEGLDDRTFCHAIREDTQKKGLLYLGTEHGVMYSPDAGKTWKSLQQNLPTVPVHDLVVKGNDLVVGTHGRSIWVLDDLTPLRQTTDAIRNQTAHLFPVQPTTHWRLTSPAPTAGFARRSNGQNPADGAVIWFHLAKAFKGETKLEVLDGKGTIIARASGKFGEKATPEKKGDDDDDDEDRGAPKPRKMEPKPGLNRYVWDLTHDGATPIPGAAVDSGGAASHIPVAPGTYTVRLKVGPLTQTQTVEVRPDPRWVTVASSLALPNLRALDHHRGLEWQLLKDADSIEADTIKRLLARSAPLSFKIADSVPALADQEKLALRVRDDITRLSDTVVRLRAVKKQIGLRKELLKDRDDAKDLVKQSEALDKKLNGIEEKLHNPKAKIAYDIFAYRGGAMLYSQFAWLLSNLIEADGAPTRAQLELADDLEKQLAGLISQFEGLAQGDIGKLNEAAKKLGVPELYVPPAKKKGEAAEK